MKRKIAPSVMCCDFFDLDSQIKDFEKNGIELLHVDVMDGSFVPNITLGTDFVKQLKKNTKILLDIHFMIENPERIIDAFDFGEGDYVSIHYESTKHLQKVLSMVKSRGARALVALNPATPIEVLADVLDDIDGILIMTVNPGFAGQKMIPHSIDKIKRAKNFLKENGREECEIEVDGNVSFENIPKMKEAGADIFVAGTSSVFCSKNLSLNIEKTRALLS